MAPILVVLQDGFRARETPCRSGAGHGLRGVASFAATVLAAAGVSRDRIAEFRAMTGAGHPA